MFNLFKNKNKQEKVDVELIPVSVPAPSGTLNPVELLNEIGNLRKENQKLKEDLAAKDITVQIWKSASDVNGLYRDKLIQELDSTLKHVDEIRENNKLVLGSILVNYGPTIKLSKSIIESLVLDSFEVGYREEDEYSYLYMEYKEEELKDTDEEIEKVEKEEKNKTNE